jgi:uncharacterized membrane protein YhaH (DUF805 family)
MNLGQAISTCFRKYADFTGTASRSEYWYFFLSYFIVELVVSRLGAIAIVLLVGFWLPLAAAGVRRLHDAAKSGWWLLFPIVNFVLLCLPTVTVNNRYAIQNY